MQLLSTPQLFKAINHEHAGLCVLVNASCSQYNVLRVCVCVCVHVKEGKLPSCCYKQDLPNQEKTTHYPDRVSLLPHRHPLPHANLNEKLARPLKQLLQDWGLPTELEIATGHSEINLSEMTNQISFC